MPDLSRTDSSFEEIPIMSARFWLYDDVLIYRLYSDIGNATSSDLAARRVLAGEIRDACVNVGFFYGQ